MVELQTALPMTPTQAVRDIVRHIVPLSLSDLDTDLLQRVARLRADLLKALDQKELVLRDYPTRRLSDDELASVAPADAMVDALRERQRALRQPRGR